MGILKNIPVVGNVINAQSAYARNAVNETAIAILIIYLVNNWFVSISDCQKKIIYTVSTSRLAHGYNDI